MNNENIVVPEAPEVKIGITAEDRTEIISSKKYKRKRQTFKQLLERNRNSEGYLFKKIASRWIFVVIRAALLLGLCFLILQPLLGKFSISIMEEVDIFDSTVITIPRNLTLENYQLTSQLINYPESLLKTFLMALATGILQIAACTLVGYGFARFNFPFKKFWFACVMLVVLVPPQTIMSSLYVHFAMFDFLGIIALFNGGSPLNLLDNPTPYLMMSATCMGLKNGLYIFMIRQYFRGVPKDVEEAAYVDGCGKLKTFFRIMLPDARAIITSCFLFSFVWQWTDAVYTTIFLRGMGVLSTSVAAIPESLRAYYQNTFGRETSPSYAHIEQLVATGMLMFILPLIILYLVAQRGFVESLSQSGIKM
jgi:multiple sugar transport system permease protein